MIACPRCGSVVERVARRPIDRLISYLVPVYRYRCRSLRCGWTGNIRQSKATAEYQAPA